MFVIREAQFEALAEARREDFVRRMMDVLRERHEAAAAMEAGRLRALVVDGMAAAETFGLHGDEDVEPFLHCRVIYGEEFPDGDDDDWAREVLEDEGIDADDKALRLEAQVAMLEHLANGEDGE